MEFWKEIWGYETCISQIRRQKTNLKMQATYPPTLYCVRRQNKKNVFTWCRHALDAALPCSLCLCADINILVSQKQFTEPVVILFVVSKILFFQSRTFSKWQNVLLSIHPRKNTLHSCAFNNSFNIFQNEDGGIMSFDFLPRCKILVWTSEYKQQLE
jgi:hypothetical protein